MSIDIYKFGVRGDSSREFNVLAPHSLFTSSVSKAVNLFGRNSEIRNRIKGLGEDKSAEIITSRFPTGEEKIVGISFPDSNEEK